MTGSSFRQWHGLSPSKGDGVMVAADISQEWLLSWWWDRYNKWNSAPVTFVNLGMSDEAKKWCCERGELISLRLPPFFVKEREEIRPELIAEWEAAYGKIFWESRGAWFRKPFACLLSPYKRTLWLDVDCEIRASINPLFPICDHPSGIGLAGVLNEKGVMCYNGGVISFQHGNDWILKWADQCIDRNGEFRGDDELFSAMIDEQKAEIGQIDPLYNWSRMYPEPQNVKILHWHGHNGKLVIRHQISSMDAR